MKTRGETEFRGALADRLVTARRSHGRRTGQRVTQEDVAAAVQVTAMAVGAWESGRNEPSLYRLSLVAQYLKCSAGWLAFGEGLMHPVTPFTPGVPMDDSEEDALEAVARDLAARPTPPAKPKRIARGGKR